MSEGQKIIDWNSSRSILYPWVGEKSPYRILLSEFLLQQTRSDQAIGYYKRMLKAFPTISKLASASEDVLMRQWQGLGYYSRARNLHKTARQIVDEYDGRVPQTYDELIRLPGIGPYTAAAISSFAFGERRAVVDGNVYRVLSRFDKITTPINSSSARKEFTLLAEHLLDDLDPAEFNQGIMNLGAQVCLPRNPDCESCPIQENCSAYADETQLLYPVKLKKKRNIDRFFHFLDITYKQQTLIEKRGKSDIWQGLYQFPLIERNSKRGLSQRQISRFLEEELGAGKVEIRHVTDAQKQTLSHQNIYSRFYQIDIVERPNFVAGPYKMVFRKNLATFAFPRSVTLYLQSS